MSRICNITDGKTTQTISSHGLGRALTAPFLASLLADWLSTHGCQDPHMLGLVVGQELHNVPALHRLAVRLLLGVVAGLAEYPMERTNAHNMAAVRLAKRLTDAVEYGVFPLPKF